MHIPDGYMSLQTSVPLIGVMAPIWSTAIRKIKKSISLRQIPLMSLCSAFSFIIMMFNIPLGGSSIHAVGAVFIAILVGPWAACISVSVALVIQAFIFGDGGILAIGANCFNMAFIMPFAGYYVYRLISGKSSLNSKRNILGVFIGSYIGINMAALFTAIEFGIQPLLFKTAAGIPEYGPYPLSISLPVMMLEHLLAAGPIEGVITVLSFVYLLKFSPEILNQRSLISLTEAKNPAGIYKKYIIGLLVLILITPLGLLATGTAWGEWSSEEIKNLTGYVPQGITKFSNFWHSLFTDYTIPGLSGSFFKSSAGYILCAVLGVILITIVMFISSRFIIKKENNQ